jgi:hypothetical protein
MSSFTQVAYYSTLFTTTNVNAFTSLVHHVQVYCILHIYKETVTCAPLGQDGGNRNQPSDKKNAFRITHHCPLDISGKAGAVEIKVEEEVDVDVPMPPGGDEPVPLTQTPTGSQSTSSTSRRGGLAMLTHSLAMD